MSDKPINTSRRDAVKLMLGGFAAVPVINLVGLGTARAEDLPHVDAATNPIAQSLHYVEDANVSERNPVTKTELPGAEQFCHNCQFVQADSGTWRPCTLFPGYAVNENGWCLSWAHNPAA